jgi:hypothetical protein
MKELIKKAPIVGNLARKVYRLIIERAKKPKPFPGSEIYWEHRYSSGGNSGVGSYEKFAEFKAEVLNAFVMNHNVKTVIEFGSGDGNQLSLANYERYIGFDVSQKAIGLCKEKFPDDASKKFMLMMEYNDETADLVISLDVIYHLIENEVFDDYMKALFKAASHYVIIYASDSDDNVGYEGTHVKHRKFTKWIQDNISDWKLMGHIPNKYPYEGDYTTGSFADFYIYEKA